MSDDATADAATFRRRVLILLTAMLVIIVAAAITVTVVLVNSAREAELRAELDKCEALYQPTSMDYWACAQDAHQ